ncbi:MAG: methyltransferase domain-containing protein [bacterium]|nr:methyltransferase domain-containing protein [bacterium]
MTTFTFIKEILKGKDLYRILMNEACERCELKGQVLDIGGGAGTPSYLRFFKMESGANVTSVDALLAGKAQVNFETDALPSANGSTDTALLLNVLEHIYHYGHLLSETNRVLRPGARLIGVVPFLINYHPDPHDYFRYTNESLREILTSAGFKDIHIQALGTGPFSASFSQIEFMIPRVLKLFVVPLALLLDRCAGVFRKNLPDQFPLGYFFTATK